MSGRKQDSLQYWSPLQELADSKSVMRKLYLVRAVLWLLPMVAAVIVVHSLRVKVDSLVLLSKHQDVVLGLWPRG